MLYKAKRGTATLTPQMRDRVLKFMKICENKKLNVMITETGRSKARQLYLYAKGRVIGLSQEKAYLGYDDPEVYSKPRERKVTWTLKSKHIEGKAIDICFKINGGINYSGDWEAVWDIAEECGLVSLFRKYGIDKPHLEFNEDWVEPDRHKAGKIQTLEREFSKDSSSLQSALRVFNNTVQELSKEKGVPYVPFKVVRG